MLRTLTTNLPPEQKQRLHPDFLANEQSYLRLRDGLLASHRGQWVAIHDGQVVASGDDLVRVTEVAAAAGGHPYIAKVGQEDVTVFRVRRSEFNYDATYQPFAMPRVTVTFWNHGETLSQTFGEVIPDTGADSSLLPESDCLTFDLFGSPYLTAVSGSPIGPSVTTLIYLGKAEIEHLRVPAFVQSYRSGTERLVGRDVLNHHRVLFDGPSGKIVFQP